MNKKGLHRNDAALFLIINRKAIYCPILFLAKS